MLSKALGTTLCFVSSLCHMDVYCQNLLFTVFNVLLLFRVISKQSVEAN